jgi:hypothetical protein
MDRLLDEARTFSGFLRKNDNLYLCAVFIFQALPHNHLSPIGSILVGESRVPKKAYTAALSNAVLSFTTTQPYFVLG